MVTGVSEKSVAFTFKKIQEIVLDRPKQPGENLELLVGQTNNSFQIKRKYRQNKKNFGLHFLRVV